MDLKLPRTVIERRFARAAVLVQNKRQRPPFQLADFQKALDKAELPVTLTVNHPVLRGLFFWAFCPSSAEVALAHRDAAVDYIVGVAAAA